MCSHQNFKASFCIRNTTSITYLLFTLLFCVSDHFHRFFKVFFAPRWLRLEWWPHGSLRLRGRLLSHFPGFPSASAGKYPVSKKPLVLLLSGLRLICIDKQTIHSIDHNKSEFYHAWIYLTTESKRTNRRSLKTMQWLQTLILVLNRSWWT